MDFFIGRVMSVVEFTNNSSSDSHMLQVPLADIRWLKPACPMSRTKELSEIPGYQISGQDYCYTFLFLRFAQSYVENQV